MDNRHISSDSIVDVVFHLKWRSADALHTDGYQASRINIWRDFLPPFLLEDLKGRQSGERVEVRLSADDALPEFDERNLFQIKSSQFDPQSYPGISPKPAAGRFYPKGLLKDVPGVFKANIQPFRCVHVNNGHLKVDFNHPLSGKDLVLSAVIGKVENKKTERGGQQCRLAGDLDQRPGHAGKMAEPADGFFRIRCVQTGR